MLKATPAQVRLATLMILLTVVLSQVARGDDDAVTAPLVIEAIGADCYVYTTYRDAGAGPYPANGMYVVTDSGAILVDPPWDTTQVGPLLDSIVQRHGVPVAFAICTHAHVDRTGGIPQMRQRGIDTWASAMTDSLCVVRGEPRPDRTFTDDTTFVLGGRQIRTMYPGPGHSGDNIVVWVDDAGVLMGGCLVKSAGSRHPGNLEHADPAAWRTSIRRVMQAFPSPTVVVPGHMDWSDPTSLQHTADLLDRWVRHTVWVLGYFNGSPADAQALDCKGLSHLVYTFLHLNNGVATLDDAEQEQVLRELLKKREQYPDLKVMAAVGGWGGCEPCSDVFSTEQGRRTFVDSLVRTVHRWGLDGIDIDWETPVLGGYQDHPARPEDRENLSRVLELLRKGLGDKALIMVDANCDTLSLDVAYDWQRILPVVNRVSLMTYSLPNDHRGITGHHTALYSSRYQQASVDAAVEALRRRQLPLYRFLIGAAFYGVEINEVDSSDLGLGQPGRFHRYATYRSIMAAQDTTTVIRGYDPVAHAPYLYQPDLRRFTTYDDPRSIREKMQYVFDHGLGGIMVWKINGDTREQDLLNALRSAFEPSQ